METEIQEQKTSNSKPVMSVNKAFYMTLKCKKSLIIHQGGTRSGKSYSILQYIIYTCLSTPSSENLSINIVRKFGPALKATIYLDFISILKNYDYYDEAYHNKSDLVYELNGHTIRFVASADNPERLKGLSGDILFINEVTEITREEWNQLAFRNRGKIIVDFNPSDPDHFIFDEMKRDKAATFITTYHDNKFLTDDQIEEIEVLQKRNPTQWKIYGTGLRAVITQGRIFSGWQKVDSLPDGPAIYGLDFGYSNDPTSLVKIVKVNDAIYLKEICYAAKMDVIDIFRAMRDEYRGEKVYCDHNQPQITEGLRRHGVNALTAKKGAGSVVEGIDFLARQAVFVHCESDNIWKEYSTYQWTLKKGFEAEDPNAWEKVPKKHQADHALDAIRMGVYSEFFKGREFFVV